MADSRAPGPQELVEDDGLIREAELADLAELEPGEELCAVPEPDRVEALSTPAILELLEHPELAADGNASVRAAAFRVLSKREGAVFARKAMRRIPGLAGDELANEGSSTEQLDVGGGIVRAGEGRPAKAPKNAAGGGGASPGGVKDVAGAKETNATVAKAAADPGVKRAVVDEAFGVETMADAYGHVSYWVVDEAIIQQNEDGFSVSVQRLDLHNRIHTRDPGDSCFSAIEEFAPFFGGPFDTAFAEFSGTVRHEQQHVEELKQAWQACYPAFVARVGAIRAGSPEEAQELYREVYEEFDAQLFQSYFACGEILARSLEWAYYHSEYEKRCGKPAGVSGGAAQAATEGAAHGRSETAKAHTAVGVTS